MSEIQGKSEVVEDKTLVNDITGNVVPNVQATTQDHAANINADTQRESLSSEPMRAIDDDNNNDDNDDDDDDDNSKPTDAPSKDQQSPTPSKRGEVVGRTVGGGYGGQGSFDMSTIKKPMSPFAKFRELDRQNSLPCSPSTPKSPSKAFSFKFTDPVVQNNAVQIKERLLSWCRAKTKEYENVEIENFSTSWNNGLAFCALLHHFRPEAFDYYSLKPENRRKNFTLAFEKAEEIADITPLLDVEDMVMMRKPDWKCVFTYVQSIYRRFKDED